MKNCKNTKGFTLVEIMIVVVIIGLLAAMAVPAFNKVRLASQAKTCVNNLRQISSAKDQYALEEGLGPDDTIATIAELVGPDEYIKSDPLCPRQDQDESGDDHYTIGAINELPTCQLAEAEAEGHVL